MRTLNYFWRLVPIPITQFSLEIRSTPTCASWTIFSISYLSLTVFFESLFSDFSLHLLVCYFRSSSSSQSRLTKILQKRKVMFSYDSQRLSRLRRGGWRPNLQQIFPSAQKIPGFHLLRCCCVWDLRKLELSQRGLLLGSLWSRKNYILSIRILLK